MPRQARKARKTFSLSSEAVRYLETVRKGKQAISSVLEDLIQQRRATEEMERVSASVSGYYDSLTDDQTAEDRAWGQFSEHQSPTEK